jgi:hypothetical protein
MDVGEEFIARLQDANRILAEVSCALDRQDVACCAARFVPAIAWFPEFIRERLVEQFNNSAHVVESD